MTGVISNGVLLVAQSGDKRYGRYNEDGVMRDKGRTKCGNVWPVYKGTCEGLVSMAVHGEMERGMRDGEITCPVEWILNHMRERSQELSKMQGKEDDISERENKTLYTACIRNKVKKENGDKELGEV
ncbi:hypothetical protein EDB85DRAFT_1889373 [Lactarius pseudohatsudake]|nr:hypothetical protein EDB85DRAFT_1889373 [Lactarius pseudohatsudake]